MYKWIESKNDKNWNASILILHPENIYQTCEWAEYKKRRNWEIVKLICIDEKNEEIGYTHVFIKKYLKIIKINYTPDAIIIKKNHLKFENMIYEKLIEKLKQNEKILNYYRLKTPKNLKLKNFELATYRLTAPQTILIDTDLASNENNYSKHHQKIFKKNSNDIHWVIGYEEHNIDALLYVLNQVKKEKKLKQKIITKMEINDAIKLFNAVIVTGYINEKVEVGCILLCLNGVAHYFYAGVTINGKKKNLGYHLIKNINKYLYSINIKKFDFGGVDLSDPNAEGVNKFKIGFGGILVENSCEIENENLIIKFMINKYINMQK